MEYGLKTLYNHYAPSVTVWSRVMDYGKGGGKDSGSNRDEDVEENKRSHTKDREKSENIKELGWMI